MMASPWGQSSDFLLDGRANENAVGFGVFE